MDPIDLLQLTLPAKRLGREVVIRRLVGLWTPSRARKFCMPAVNSGSGVAVFMS